MLSHDSFILHFKTLMKYRGIFEEYGNIYSYQGFKVKIDEENGFVNVSYGNNLFSIYHGNDLWEVSDINLFEAFKETFKLGDFKFKIDAN